MTKQTVLDALTGKTSKTTKAPTAKAQTPAQRKGFKARDLPKALIVKAKQVWAQYQKDPAAPKVTERDGSWRRGPMLAVAYAWGFSSNADGDAKVQALQTSMGKPLTGPNGIMDFASESYLKRLKCMGTVVATGFRAVPDRSGTYFLKPTSKAERAKANVLSATPVKATKGKAPKTAPKARDASRSNGAVTLSVDKALRSAAHAAERAEQRKANRAKQAAQGKAPTIETSTDQTTD